jgi:catechol 2,3-dioxygenase-like lactoylglutathione lyase family enzyme
MAEIQRIGNVYFVVHDVEQAVRFYRDVLGLKQKFRDGDRWVAFDVGGTTLAVAGPEEAPLIGGTGPFVSLRTDDLDGLVAQLRQRGAEVTDPIGTGHERRAHLTVPGGTAIVLYEPARG